MACVFWKDECETTTKEFMKKSNHEYFMKLTTEKLKIKMNVKEEVLPM